MAVSTKRPGGGAALPSRDEIAAFFASATGKVGAREVARAFGIGAAQKGALKDLLRDLEEDGTLARRGRRISRAGQLPPILPVTIVARDKDGELLAEPLDWDRSDGPAPRIAILPGRRLGGRQRPAGLGDRALLRLDRRATAEGGYVGRIQKVLPNERATMLGVFRSHPAGGGRLVPVDKKAAGRELTISPGDENGAVDGDLVSVTLAGTGAFGAKTAKVRERLGSLTSEKAVSLVAIHAHAIPHVFAAETLAEAEQAKPATLKGREDWRALPLVTIDPPDAKDHDDAVHAAPDDDPGNAGGHVVTVAIADVAAYVREGAALDREALERGNSVYFPDRVVPMLPERISNDLCSLREGEARPALAVRMVFDKNGHKRSHAFHRVMMRSAAKLSYAQAQAAIDGQPDDATGPLLDPVLRPLWAAYSALATARDERGPLFLDLPERKILLKPDGTVDRVIVPQRLEAHRLIEEFMIAANVAAAETLEKAKSPLIYRVHDEPSLEKMRALGDVLASVGIKLPKAGALRPSLFNGILRQVTGSKHEIFINEVVLRSQAQAEYAAENYGHFGLNLRRYAHFTSPIRRYADLVVHRGLIRAAGLGGDGLRGDATSADLAKIAESISVAERRAMVAERETVDRLIAFHLSDRVGASFAGRISGVTRSGLFVKLAETGADGFVPAATLGADYYRHDEARHALVGQRTGETFRLGDPVEVRLVEAAPVAGALRFEIMSEGGATPGRGRRGAGRASEARASKGAGGPRKSKAKTPKGRSRA
ncbi:ribonuclease R [Enterovirga rhinocerotis]|uniref:Ribonuclease R n=1 Tax=Enterovirga rhinocerotis TaxID=1339210 RepID=A0A4R7C845_9HYPH|nr:ribonuclease R [Enterovirga rhinocerotis]TDR94383.1 ribonuclease R [Enterovirga rhinocerotis]